MSNFNNRESHALGVSCGTLATLSGFHRYDDLDHIRNDWVTWIQSVPDKEWDTWQSCWKDYFEDKVNQ